MLTHRRNRRQNDARGAVGEIGKERYARASFGWAFDSPDRLVARAKERDAVGSLAHIVEQIRKSALGGVGGWNDDEQRAAQRSLQ